MTRRLLVVARRFWPLCDEDCHRLLAWASTLRQHGIEVTLLTGRWHTSWPGESDVREIKIVRLLPAPRSSWNETLFLRNVASWITKYRSQFDLIYVDESLSLLHQITVKSVRDKIPVIARFTGTSLQMHAGSIAASFQLSALSSATEACRNADCIIAPTAHAQRQLLAGGIRDSSIIRIADAPWWPVVRSQESKKEAAVALRSINSDLRIPGMPGETKLLLYVGPLDEHVVIEPFIRAAIGCLELGYLLKFWIIGTGRKLSGLYDIVKQATYHHEILFCSHFDHIDELYQVADGIALGLNGVGQGYYLPQSIASALPVLAVDSPEFRPLVPKVLHESLIPSYTHADVQKSMLSWLTESEDWLSRAEQAKQSFLASNELEGATRAWVRLINELGP